MSARRWFLLVGAALSSAGCAVDDQSFAWKQAVDEQAALLGHRNWIVVAEASFPAYNRPGLRQVSAPVEIPEAIDYVLNALERTEHVRPRIYLTREQRSLENDYAPGIEEFRDLTRSSLHGHEALELDQSSLLAILEDVNLSFDVLIVRTASALPYTSVFLELHPGYWDAEAEEHLRARIRRERLDRLALPNP